jgi:hypothetical protein
VRAGRSIITGFWQTVKKLQNYSKATPKTTPKTSNPTLPTVSRVFCFLFWSFGVKQKCIEKTRFLGRGRSRGRVGWLEGWVFGAYSKTPKNFTKCLIFNGLVFWSSLWSGFGVVLE